MSTRATVWIRSDKENVSRFIYHHCDGYALDEEIDPKLKELKDWSVTGVVRAVSNIDSMYREVDGVGWDSEYVYKIDVDEHKMYKYDTGIGDPEDEADFEKRLTVLEDTYDYTSSRERTYEEALEDARRIHGAFEHNSLVAKALEEVFHELKESDDERIAREIWDYINGTVSGENPLTPRTSELEEWHNWLENKKK